MSKTCHSYIMGKGLLPLTRMHPDMSNSFTQNLSIRNKLSRIFVIIWEEGTDGGMVKVDFTEKEGVLRSICLAFSKVWLVLGGRPYSIVHFLGTSVQSP